MVIGVKLNLIKPKLIGVFKMILGVKRNENRL